MSLEPITVIHKYDVADFTTYSYWLVFFSDAGTFSINGSPVTAPAGTTLDIQVFSVPIYITGSTELYLLGSECVCGPFYPAYTGSTSNEYPVPTRYYDGNIGNGRDDRSPSTPYDPTYSGR